jgi:hypothetical protein
MNATIKQIGGADEHKSAWNWPSTILRVGIIGLVVFLTQILIQLYRYNSRLIVFYGSRHDALLLAGEDLGKLERYAKVFFPADLDFGREPRHPLREMAEFLRRAPKSATADAGQKRKTGKGRKRASGDRGRT